MLEFEAAERFDLWLNEMKWGCPWPDSALSSAVHSSLSLWKRCLGSPALVCSPRVCCCCTWGLSFGGLVQWRQPSGLPEGGPPWLSVALVSHLSSVTYHPLPASQSIPATFQSGHRLGSRHHWPSQRRLKGWGLWERGHLCCCGKCCCSAPAPPEADAGAVASLGLSLLSHLCWGLVPLLEPI